MIQNKTQRRRNTFLTLSGNITTFFVLIGNKMASLTKNYYCRLMFN